MTWSCWQLLDRMPYQSPYEGLYRIGSVSRKFHARYTQPLYNPADPSLVRGTLFFCLTRGCFCGSDRVTGRCTRTPRGRSWKSCSAGRGRRKAELKLDIHKTLDIVVLLIRTRWTLSSSEYTANASQVHTTHCSTHQHTRVLQSFVRCKGWRESVKLR